MYLVFTLLSFDLLALGQQSVFRRLWAERHRQELIDRRKDGQSEQDGPELRRAQNGLHSKNLRHQNRNGNHQLVDGADLKIKVSMT